MGLQIYSSQISQDFNWSWIYCISSTRVGFLKELNWIFSGNFGKKLEKSAEFYSE
jgi:hypothetical protein